MDIAVRVKEFLSEPLNTFDASKENLLEEALKYYVALAAVYSVFSAVLSEVIFSMFGPLAGFGILGLLLDASSGTDIAILSFVFSVILIFIWGAFLHIFVYLVGGRKGIKETVKASMYGSAPGLLSGWIPVFGIIGFIWSSVLMVIGIRQFQEVTTGRAIVAVLVPIFIFLILIIAVLAVIAQFVMRMGSIG